MGEWTYSSYRPDLKPATAGGRRHTVPNVSTFKCEAGGLYKKKKGKVVPVL